MPIHTDYIRSVLKRYEGDSRKGYIPQDRDGTPIGASGVTIGAGLDLGQQSRQSLAAMGLSEALMARFRPYLGIQGRAAQYVLSRDPLELSAEETEALNAAVHERYIRETADLFGRQIFDAAPQEAQAVATSLHYQFGALSRKNSPALAGAVEALRRGEYALAASLLRERSGWSLLHQRYLLRRKDEARLLESISPEGGQ
jgi:hypothetical protein